MRRPVRKRALARRRASRRRGQRRQYRASISNLLMFQLPELLALRKPTRVQSLEGA